MKLILASGSPRRSEILKNAGYEFVVKPTSADESLPDGILSPDEYNNPYIFDASGNVPTFITVGALDYLKKDAVAWAHKLSNANVKTKLVVYNGLGHGYLNATGVFPQAEDVIDEMGKFIYTILEL